MNNAGFLSVLFTVAIAIPFDADARGRSRSSHWHSPAPAVSQQYASNNRGGENYLGASVKSSTPRNSNAYSGNSAANTEDDPVQRRLNQEWEAAYAKTYAEKTAARQAKMAADKEEQSQLLEQAAIRAIEEQKRKEAEATIKNREFAMLDRQKRQAAWEARCQIMPVMSDEEIATCKEVWSKPAR